MIHSIHADAYADKGKESNAGNTPISKEPQVGDSVRITDPFARFGDVNGTKRGTSGLTLRAVEQKNKPAAYGIVLRRSTASFLTPVNNSYIYAVQLVSGGMHAHMSSSADEMECGIVYLPSSCLTVVCTADASRRSALRKSVSQSQGCNVTWSLPSSSRVALDGNSPSVVRGMDPSPPTMSGSRRHESPTSNRSHRLRSSVLGDSLRYGTPGRVLAFLNGTASQAPTTCASPRNTDRGFESLQRMRDVRRKLEVRNNIK